MSDNYEVPSFVGKAICIIGVIIVIIMESLIISKKKDPILPVTRYDKCVASGVAKSPSISSTMKRNTSYSGFSIPESV